MRIIGGSVFDLKEGFVARDLCTEGKYIAEVSTDGAVLDASGCYVIPGLVDVHFHGCMGQDLSDASPEGLQTIANYQLKNGITCICPASMTLSEEQLTAICRVVAARDQDAPGAEVAGIHLEGPFVSMAKKGAQNGAYVRDPDIDMLRRLQEAANGAVKLLTMAPELPAALDFIREAGAMGVNVSVGHTESRYETAKAAFAAGARHTTHLFNAMSPLHHRDPGVVGAAADSKGVMAEIICDGVHIHEGAVRLAFRLFGPERMVLISDSLRATGMPDGRYPFGGQEINVRGNRATMTFDDSVLAGSVTNLMGCVRQAVAFGIPLADAVRAASYNPAKAIGVADRIGTLELGKEASVVLLDKKDLSVRTIVYKGILQ